MEAIHLSSFLSSPSELHNLHPQAVPLPPSPGPDQVLVQVHHAALNHVDLLYAQGKHQNNTSLIRPPFTLGLEFAGVVKEVGPSAADTTASTPSSSDDKKEDEKPCRFNVGDRVFGAHLGAFAELILVPARSLHRLPASIPISLRESTALASGAPVAYGAVALRGGVKRGDWVLVHGAAGGIGVYACQIVRALGAKVIAGVRRAEDVERKLGAMGLGVDGAVVTADDADWEKEVTRLTGGRGVDVVIDNVGLVRRSLRCLTPRGGGRIVLVGFAGRDGVMENVAMNRILLRQAVIVGYRYGETDRQSPEETRRVWDGLMGLVGLGTVRPIVFDKRYRGLGNVPTAMADLLAGRVYGKAVIEVRCDGNRATL